MPIITLSCIFLLPANKIRDLGQSRYINSFFLGKGFFKLQEEVFLVEIQGKNYYTDSEKNGTIYQCLDDEDIGDKVGIFDKNGVAIFD